MRGSHIKLGEGERKVRLGQDSLPNKAEMSGDYIHCFTRSPETYDNIIKTPWASTIKYYAVMMYRDPIFSCVGPSYE